MTSLDVPDHLSFSPAAPAEHTDMHNHGLQQEAWDLQLGGHFQSDLSSHDGHNSGHVDGDAHAHVQGEAFGHDVDTGVYSHVHGEFDSGHGVHGSENGGAHLDMHEHSDHSTGHDHSDHSATHDHGIDHDTDHGGDHGGGHADHGVGVGVGI